MMVKDAFALHNKNDKNIANIKNKKIIALFEKLID